MMKITQNWDHFIRDSNPGAESNPIPISVKIYWLLFRLVYMHIEMSIFARFVFINVNFQKQIHIEKQVHVETSPTIVHLWSNFPGISLNKTVEDPKPQSLVVSGMDRMGRCIET